jgi:hypothetical protein
LGAARLLGLPSPDQGWHVIAWSALLVPALGSAGGPHHRELMRDLGRDQEGGSHVAAVEHMGARPQLTGGSVVHHRRPHHTIRRGGGRRAARRHQLRRAPITARREVPLIAHPIGRTLTTVARLEVIGRGKADRCGRLRVARAPAERCEPRHGPAGIRLPPDPPPRLQGGESPGAERGVGGRHPRQERIAVRADRPGERRARAGIVRHADVVGPEAIAGLPFRRHLLAHPGGRRRTELMERIMPRFRATRQAVLRANRRQNRRRIRPGRARRLQPPPRVAGGQAGTRGPVGRPHGSARDRDHRAAG